MTWETLWPQCAQWTRLNPAQEFRRRLIVEALSLRPGARVIDAGSGQGELLQALRAEFPGISTLGIELSAAGIAQSPPGDYLQRDLAQPLAPPTRYAGWATHAVCAEVLEHVVDPVAFLRHLRAYLAPGAKLIVTVPAGPKSAFDRHVGHLRHFTPAHLRRVLVEAGFRAPMVRAAGFPVFNLYRLAVVAAGPRLIRATQASRPPALLVRFAARLAALGFKLNLSNAPFGWQLIGVSVV